MKIYNKIVINMDTGEVLEEDSFKYHGPIIQCGGSSPIDVGMTILDPANVFGQREGPLDLANALDPAGAIYESITDETHLRRIADPADLLSRFSMPDIPEFDNSPTYVSDRVGNTISEGISVARCYGKCKIGGNKIRFNAADATDLRIIVAHCMGEVNGITRWEVNDIEWSELTGTHTKTEYKGTRTQTVDGRFNDRASAYRSMAYTAFTFKKNDKQIGYNPNITVVMEGLKCLPLAGGANAFTRNPAVILYDWYLNVEGYSAGDLDLNSFKSLEALCDEIPSGSSLPRYRFDFNFDVDVSINDAKKLIWSSFNGRTLMSQGKIKSIWDSGQMADGSGGLTTKLIFHAFDMDNIVKDSFTWSQLERPNTVRIHFKDSTKNYKNSSVEIKDEADIAVNGEILYEEKCWYITNAELARRRCRLKYNRKRYADYGAKFTAKSGAGDIEVLDAVTITHTLPGWTAKGFLIKSRGEDEVGRMKFTAEAYYLGAYDDVPVGTQEGYESDLPNPYQVPAASTGVSAAMTAVGTAYDFDAVRVSFTPPTTEPFYSHTEIFASNDDSTYYYVGRDSTGTFTFSALGVIYEPGDTCYIKIRSVNTIGVPEDLPAAYDTSVLISSTMRLGSFYAGTYDFWGGNAAIGNAATKIVIGNLDGTVKIALGPSADAITFAGTQAGFYVDGDGNLRLGGATHGLKFNAGTGVLEVPTKVKVGTGTYIDIDGANARIRSSNYVSGVFGSGFTLEPDLLEVGNIACRGIFRTAVFQKDVVSAIGGNLAVMPADVLATTMTAADASTLTIEGNESFAVGDFLRIKDGTEDEWFEVTNIGSAPTYTVTRDKAADYGANANPAWPKGASVINYGASGQGAIYMTASETNAPYLSVFTHAGAPWTTITTRLRLGNLNGYGGYSSDEYGLAIYKDANNFFKADLTDGIQMATNGIDAIVIKSGGGISIEQGGDIILEGGPTNFSLIRFKTAAYPGTLRFEYAADSTKYFSLSGSAAGSLYLGPSSALEAVYPSIHIGIIASMHYTHNLNFYSDYLINSYIFGDNKLQIAASIINMTVPLHITNSASVLSQLESTIAGATGVIQEIYHNSASPADGDLIESIKYYGKNSTPVKTQYWESRLRIDDITAGTEDSSIHWFGIANGATNLAYYYNGDGNAYADEAWNTFSADILKHPDYKNKEVIAPKDYLNWALEDAKKPIKPYKGIPEDKLELKKYSKDIGKIAIGIAIWAEDTDRKIKELEQKINLI